VFSRRQLLVGTGALAASVLAVTGRRVPSMFIPHGGGPWPVLPLPGFGRPGETESLAAYMRSLGTVAPSPRALVVVSAHWEATVPTVQTAAAPPMLYDYSGFPPAAYELNWPAPGSPAIAARVRELLGGAGFKTAEDPHRGYDHGTFVPLMLAWPTAPPPTIQLSLKAGLDPAEHLAMGRALAPLRDEGVLIVGSGNSWHNLRALFGGDSRHDAISAEFDAWLTAAVTARAVERDALLADWARAPGARASHPREEHLIPLMVAAGAAGDDPGAVAWRGRMAGKVVAGHHFGG